MVRVGIYTMDPAFGGGILSLSRSCYQLEERLGHSPSLTYILMGEATGGAPRIHHWDGEDRLDGVRRVSVRPPLNIKSWTMRQLSCIPSVLRRLHGADVLIGVAGSASALFPLSLQKRPYACWIPTSLEDELRGQVTGGGKAAARILSSRFLLRQALWQEERVLRRAAAILVTSAHTGAMVGAKYAGTADRIRVVMPQIHLPEPAELGKGPRGQIVLTVGRLTDSRKNIPLLLKAFACVADRHPAWTLALAGGQPTDTFLRLCEELRISDRTQWLGQVSSARLRELYNTAGAFVLPSLQEGLGLVLLEAMASGLPVIATRCGGPEGFILDQETGFLVPNDDPVRLVSALDSLLREAETRERVGRAGRTFVRDYLNVETIAGQYCSAMHAAFPGQYVSEGVAAG